MPLGTFKATLMGAAAGGFSATGGTITTSGDYTIHTFTSSGNFVIESGEVNIEYLVVAGGGGGGGSHPETGNGYTAGGGGGAGGFRTGTLSAVTVGSYSY